MEDCSNKQQDIHSSDDIVRTQPSDETLAFFLKVKSASETTGYARKYPLSPIWQSNMNFLAAIIHSKASPAAKLSAVHDTFMFSVNTAQKELKERMVDWYIRFLRKSGIILASSPRDIQESHYSNPQNTVMREGRLLSPDFLRTVVLFLEIQQYCKLPDQGFCVLELGAGYGGLARTAKLFYPNVSYVIIDIPESLYFSSTFLRLNFPDAKFCYVTEASCLKAPIRNYDFVFVPTMFAEELVGTDFTLFCNTASLGEMKNSTVRYWMDVVENKVQVRYFFGLNRFLNTIHPEHHRFRLSENACSVSLDAAWRILQWEVEPPFTRCPYLETEVTRNLEIIAERLPRETTDSRERLERSWQLVEDLMRQDWFVYGDDDNTMKLRDNVLAPDLTMEGTLFALWESIRLHPNPVNVGLMLRYLVSLTRGKPFEEMFHYRDLLDGLLKDPVSVQVMPTCYQDLLGRLLNALHRQLQGILFLKKMTPLRQVMQKLLPLSIRGGMRRLYYGS